MDDVVVHAYEESPALVRIGVDTNAEEVVFALVIGNGWSDEFAGFSISTTAHDAALVENVTLVTGKVDAAADHADEEVAAAVCATRDSEKFIGAVDLLSGGRGERECDQGDSDYCRRESFT